MKAPVVVSPELRSALKALKLGPLVDVLPERLALAEAQELSFEETLLLLLSDEVSRRESSACAHRAKRAGLDPAMTMERWDPSSKVRYDKRVLTELMSLRFVEAKKNALILGPVGVGKTFLANALGHVATRHGYNVILTRADDMLRRLKQSRMDNSREAVIAELVATDLLIVDDFALERMSRDESRDVYQLIVERNGRAPTVVTSNRDTAEWIAAFDDTLLAQSAVDRFIHSAYDLVVEGESYRARLKPKLRDEDPPPKTPVAKKPVIGRAR
ncbi:MAG: IS21-like element helper ATPase IstB [Sandaracinus sp.]